MEMCGRKVEREGEEVGKQWVISPPPCRVQTHSQPNPLIKSPSLPNSQQPVDVSNGLCQTMPSYSFVRLSRIRLPPEPRMRGLARETCQAN